MWGVKTSYWGSKNCLDDVKGNSYYIYIIDTISTIMYNIDSCIDDTY